MTGRPLRIATRSSELALFQARQVAAALQARGVESELVTYTTLGDRRLDQPLNEIGAKGLFTHELEADLAAGRVDCCVHSLKDLPTADPDGLEVVALLARADARDAFVVRPGIEADSLADLPAGARVGTSSLRRRAQLLALRPDLEVAELRGNVPTRLRKLDEGQVDAAILAAAGLQRLGLGARIRSCMDGPGWLPAAGQGAIAVQARRGDAQTGPVLRGLDDAGTRRSVAAERAFLAALEGGCQVPIGAMTIDTGGGRLVVHGLVASLDGRTVVRGELPVGDDAASAGRQLAALLMERGAREVLREVRGSGPVPAPQPE